MVSDKGGRSFRYQKRSSEDVKERANMKGGGFDSWIKPAFKTFKPKDGKNIIRVLPPTWEGAKHYGYDIFVNYGIGVDNQSYLSLSKMKQEADPLQEARKEAERDGDKELTKALSPNQRILMWLIDRNDEDEGPQLWAAPFTVDKAFANLSFDEDTKDVVFIDDPEQGCDIRFYKEGTGLTTKYDASKMRLMKPSHLHEDQGLQDEWLAFIQDNPLPTVLNFYDYDHIAAVFGGQVRVNPKDDPEAEVKPRSRRDAPAEDEPPPRRTRPVQAEDTEPPPRRRPVAEDEPPPRRERARVEPEAEEGQSVRERLASRRTRVESKDDPPFDPD